MAIQLYCCITFSTVITYKMLGLQLVCMVGDSCYHPWLHFSYGQLCEHHHLLLADNLFSSNVQIPKLWSTKYKNMNQEMSHAYASSCKYNVTFGTKFMDPEYCLGTTLLTHLKVILLCYSKNRRPLFATHLSIWLGQILSHCNTSITILWIFTANNSRRSTGAVMNSLYTCQRTDPNNTHRRQTEKQLELSLPRSFVINLSIYLCTCSLPFIS